MTKAKTTTKLSKKKSGKPAPKKPLVKLNLGAGEHWLDGWDNVDVVMPTTKMVSGGRYVDLGSFPWPMENESANCVMASHILEHFPKTSARLFLAECHRILNDGGELHIAVPDMDKFIDAKLSGDWSSLEGYHWTDFNWFFGGNEQEKRPEMRHYYMYNIETLQAMVLAAGFKNAEERKPLPEDNMRYKAISLYVTAVK